MDELNKNAPKSENKSTDKKLLIIIVLLILLFLLLGLGIGYFIGMSMSSGKCGCNSDCRFCNGGTYDYDSFNGEVIDLTSASVSSGEGSNTNDGESGSSDESNSSGESSSSNENGSSDESVSSDESGSSVNDSAASGSEENAADTTTTTTATTTTTTTTTARQTTTTSTKSAAATVIAENEWTETPLNDEFYIAFDCYSRQKAIIGAAQSSYLKKGTKVTVTAKTDTGYYKLTDGSFVHGDYLSKTKPVTTTTTTTTKSAAVTTTKTSSGNSPECLSVEYEVFLLMNEYRTRNGLSEFKWSNELYSVSVLRAKECTQYWSHTRPDGTSCGTALDQAGIKWTKRGENIARGQKSAQEVFNSWVNSEDHRENILNPEFNYMTVAVMQNSEGKLCWVQTFVKM